MSRVFSIATTIVLTFGATSVTAAAEDMNTSGPLDDPIGHQGKVTLQRITAESPFPDGCDVRGTPNTDAEAEVSLAVNPSDADHLLATWQQDRFSSGGGSNSDLVAVTRDGGETWSSPTTVREISRCTGGRYDRATDPQAAIGADGTAYLASLSFPLDPPSDVFNWPGAEQVSISPDGGHSWSTAPSIVESDVGFLEWEHLAVDPVRPERLYMVWERLVADGVTGIMSDGHIRFARSEDRGATWSEPITVPPDEPGMSEAPFGGIHAVRGEDGSTTLVLIYLSMPFTTRNLLGPSSIRVVRSYDLGENWSSPVEIVTAAGGTAVDPEKAVSIAGGFRGWPSIGALGRDGTLIVSWTEAVGTLTTVRFARSIDAGATWSTGTVATLPAQAFLPTVAVARDGTLGAFWYDLRNDIVGDDELTTDVWFAHSTDDGGTWEQRHLTGPFDTRSAAVDQGGTRYFLGDYAQMVGLPNGFGALFPIAPGEEGLAEEVVGPSDVVFARITLPKEK